MQRSVTRLVDLSLGSLRLVTATDGAAHYDPEAVVTNIEPEVREAALRDHLDGAGKVVVPYNPLLIRTPDRLVLVDAGLGELAHAVSEPAGRVLESLGAAGVAPEEVDVVIVTHCHPDHIGGLTEMREGRRQPVFTRAQHIVWASEWEFWTSESSLAQLPDMLAAPARIHLPPLHEADLVQVVSSESELLPGIRLIPTPGHTPGHASLVVDAGGEKVVFAGDALFSPLHFENPGWVSPVDALPDETIATRKKLLDEVANQHLLLAAYHLDGAGHVSKRGQAYVFETV